LSFIFEENCNFYWFMLKKTESIKICYLLTSSLSFFMKNISPFVPTPRGRSTPYNGPTMKSLVHDSSTPSSPKIVNLTKENCNKITMVDSWKRRCEIMLCVLLRQCLSVILLCWSTRLQLHGILWRPMRRSQERGGCQWAETEQ
jgi:hypothetical protein